MVWNMGAIAAHAQATGGDDAIKLFRSVLLASSSIPGAFPPVLIDVEGNGKHFQEMHVDGGVAGQFYVTPPALMASNSGYRIPATQLYIVINSSLQPQFRGRRTHDTVDPDPVGHDRDRSRPAPVARPRLCRREEQRHRF